MSKYHEIAAACGGCNAVAGTDALSRAGADGVIWLEAEIHPKSQSDFNRRYFRATKELVNPGHPAAYKDQPNKWGMQLRVYFNMGDEGVARLARTSRKGIKVETRAAGYKTGPGGLHRRVSDNDFFWSLVEHGMRLGPNARDGAEDDAGD